MICCAFDLAAVVDKAAIPPRVVKIVIVSIEFFIINWLLLCFVVCVAERGQ